MNDKNNSSLSRLFHKINRPFWISFICVGIPLILFIAHFSKGEGGWMILVLSPVIMPLIAIEYIFATFYTIVSASYLILRIVKRQ